jgi:hypothetical protein
MGRALRSLGLGLAASLIGAAASAGVLSQKPALSVSAANGDLTGYSAAQTLDMSRVMGGDASFTAKVNGNPDSATYGLDFRVTERTSDTHDETQSLSFGASWNESEAALRSSMGRRMGFGLVPSANFLRLSMDMNALQPTAPGSDAVGRADISSALTLGGRPVGSFAIGAGNRGEERVAVSFTRPLQFPAEFTLSTQERNDGPPDQRVVMRLLKVDW